MGWCWGLCFIGGTRKNWCNNKGPSFPNFNFSIHLKVIFMYRVKWRSYAIFLTSNLFLQWLDMLPLSYIKCIYLCRCTYVYIYVYRHTHISVSELFILFISPIDQFLSLMLLSYCFHYYSFEVYFNIRCGNPNHHLPVINLLLLSSNSPFIECSGKMEWSLLNIFLCQLVCH